VKAARRMSFAGDLVKLLKGELCLKYFIIKIKYFKGELCLIWGFGENIRLEPDVFGFYLYFQAFLYLKKAKCARTG
jgi:hypothetical protein